MLKKLFVGLFVLTLATVGLGNQPVSATNNNITIDNILALCENSLSHGYSIDGSDTCDAYNSAQMSAILERSINVWDHITLKNLDLTFRQPNAQFYIQEGGSLIIDGGHYTSPSCIVWIQYNNTETPSYYVASTTYTINSGVFEATTSTAEGIEAPSPVCLVSAASVTSEEAQRIIAGYLPVGRQFINMETRSLTTEIPVGESTVRLGKTYDITETVEHLQTRIVAVVENEDLGEEELEEELEEPNTDEPELEERPETEDSVEIEQEDEPESKQKDLPKTPNTGIFQAAESNNSIAEIGFVIFTVVIFTTIIWGYIRYNR